MYIEESRMRAVEGGRVRVDELVSRREDGRQGFI